MGRHRISLFLLIILLGCAVDSRYSHPGLLPSEKELLEVEKAASDSIIKELEKLKTIKVDIGKERFTIEVPEERREITRWLHYYRTRGKAKFLRAYRRMLVYAPIIKEKFREEGLPEELAYLPFVESNFNPYARSRAGALGIWQFMRSTARKYGLRVDWWIDERRDPIKSTDAAVKYLKDLFEMLGRWDLVLASYNVGEGKILRKLRKHGKADFWSIRKYLPKETREYIPAFMAVLLILKNPEEHGFKLDTFNITPLSFDTVVVPKPADIKLLAKWASMREEEFRRLNPEFIRWATPPYMKNFTIKIKRGRKDLFYARMEKEKNRKWVSALIHRVRRGETLWGIARRYGVSLTALKKMNGLRNPRYLRPGQILKIPIPKSYAYRKTKKSRRKSKYRYYIVRRGDSLWSISRRFGVPLNVLKKWNGLRRTTIYPGQRIIVGFYES